jgi:hypothetical protein
MEFSRVVATSESNQVALQLPRSGLEVAFSIQVLSKWPRNNIASSFLEPNCLEVWLYLFLLSFCALEAQPRRQTIALKWSEVPRSFLDSILLKFFRSHSFEPSDLEVTSVQVFYSCLELS